MKVALLGLFTALLLVATAAGASRPAVWLVQASPVTIAGNAFAAHSRVAVAYSSAGKRWSRTLTTSGTGTFRTTIAGASFARCKGVSVKAGAASLRVLPCSARNGKPAVEGNLAGDVAGSAFVPRERVTIAARAGDADPVSTTTTAGDAGAFATRLILPHTKCVAVLYSARGALGSTATFETPAPDCMQP
jgi:hypothetical protein